MAWNKDHLSNKLSPNVFNCKTLTVLKLKNLCLIIDLLPHQVHIPLLKILHMHRVMFKDYQQIIKLLSGCPILEELELQTYTLLTPPRVNLPSGGSIRYMPNLVRAAIFNNAYIPFFLFSGARILRTKLVRTVLFYFILFLY
jgi:hypothetical protein